MAGKLAGGNPRFGQLTVRGGDAPAFIGEVCPTSTLWVALPTMEVVPT